MFTLKRILFFVLLFTQNDLVFSQKKIKVIFVYNDSQLSSQQIKEKTNFFISTVGVKKCSFEIYHFTNNKEEMAVWPILNSNVVYTPSKKECDFNFCKSLFSLVSYTKTIKSRLYSNDQLNCKFEIENVKLQDSDQSTVINELNKEKIRLGKEKTNQTIYFIFDRDKLNKDLELNFDPEVLSLKIGELVLLKPIIKGQVGLYLWSPNEGLNCINCKNPEVKVTKNQVYELLVTDSAGCSTITKKIQIQIEDKCECADGIEKAAIIFNNPKLKNIKKNDKIDTQHEYEIISNHSGDFIFDVLTNSNCAETFNLRILNQVNQEFYNLIYDRNEVDIRSEKPLNKLYPDKFVFRINLTDKKKELRLPDNRYFKIIITSYDRNNIPCDSYQSPTLKFTPCE